MVWMVCEVQLDKTGSTRLGSRLGKIRTRLPTSQFRICSLVTCGFEELEVVLPLVCGIRFEGAEGSRSGRLALFSSRKGASDMMGLGLVVLAAFEWKVAIRTQARKQGVLSRGAGGECKQESEGSVCGWVACVMVLCLDVLVCSSSL